jgi:hypothetical protein
MITQTRSQATGPIVAKTFLAGLLGCLACQPAPVLAVDPAPRTPPPEARMSDIVETRLYPQLDYFFTKLSEEKEAVTLDGVVAFKGKDKFLPGKIAVGLSYLLVNTPRSDPRFARYLKDYRDIADLTIGMDNETWGIYYYLLALNKLKTAGLLEEAISAPTLARLKQQLDWRRFVTQTDYKLINLPTNYYGVAFSVARLRMLLGWEVESGSRMLLDKMMQHYEKYSGKFGFSDETDGEGRFDRYSILLIAEICQRFIETGLTVTPELKALLRKSADVAFNIGNTAGEGFSFGRSIGPYGDTAVLEILSTAAYLDVLTAEEKQYAYAYSTRIVARYADFWFDPKTRSVDMWGQGRRTDAYRGKHRILGENFSLLHQLISTNTTWKKAGFDKQKPPKDFDAWLDKTQPAFSLTWFARGEYDRALAIFRDKGHVFSLLLQNGGAGQHDNSPYYPLPFSSGIVAGVADSGARHPQLMPKFTLADGSELMATAYMKDIKAESKDSRHTVTWRQEELTRLGKNAPIKDARIAMTSEYRLEPGAITRTDVYTAKDPVEVAGLSLEFASFSSAAQLSGTGVKFGEGIVHAFEVGGLDNCRLASTGGNKDYQSTTGAMRTLVTCETGRFTLDRPLTVKWVMRYR